MGFLDDLGHAAAKLGHGLAQIPGDIGEATVAPFGFVLDVALAPFTGDEQDSFADDVKSSFAYHGKQVLGAVGDQPENLKDVAMGTLGADQALWEGPVSRGLSTAVTTAHSPDPGWIFNPQNWRDNWNASEYVDIGDALYNSAVGVPGRALRSAGVPAGAIQNTVGVYATSLIDGLTFGMYTGDESEAKSITALTDPNFDPRDREQAHTAFDTGIGKPASAMAEFGVRWYADPLYLAGKGAMVAREAKVIKPIHGEADVERALATGVRDRRGLGKLAAKAGVAEPRTAGTGADKFERDLAALGTPELRHDYLMRTKVVQATLLRGGGAGPALVHMLAKAETPEARAAIIRLGVDPTARNARKLAREDAEAEAAFFSLKDGRIHSLERMLGDQRLTNMHPAFQIQLRAAEREAALLERRYGDAWRRANLAGGLRSAPRVSAGQQLSNLVGFPVFQASRYNLPGRVYKAALTKRGQMIDLNRPGAAAVQGRIAMDRVGHGFGALGSGHGMSAQEKGALQLRITAATSIGETQAGIRATEDAIAAHYAGRLELNQANFAQLVAVTRDKRDAALARHSGESSFSGGVTPSGERLDEVRLGEDGVLERIALSHTDMANKMPMIDVDALARVARRFSHTINGMTPVEFKAYLEGWQPSRAQRFRKYPDQMLDQLNQVWKPLQLMRLGWPIRVLVDEQLRIMAHVGVISMIPLWEESVRKSLVASRGADQAAKMMDLVRMPLEGRRLGRDIDEAIAAALGGRPAVAGKASKASATDRLAKSRETGKFAGQRTAKDMTGREQTYGDVMEGEFGDIMKRLVSSNPDFRLMMTGATAETMPDGLLGVLRQGAGNPITIKPLPDSVIQSEIEAHAVAYTAGWEKAVNEQIGMDPIFRQILKGETDERIVSWLRYSKEGRALRKENPIRANKQGLETWIATLRQHVDTYLPSPALRELALENRARVSHLNEHFENDLAARPAIHGESIDNDRGVGLIWGLWNKIVEAQYRYLGAAPTNVLSRHPYAAYVYRQEMDRQIAQWAPDPTIAGGSSGRISHDELERMRNRAREHTIGEVRHTLYELANQSNLAHTMRFIMPFYQAWQEVLMTWGRLALADPSRIARLNSLWEAPSRLDATYTDPADGKEYVALPNFLKPLLGGSDKIGMPKDWVRQLMFNNEYWFTPGVGPTVQVPLGELIRHKPTLEDNVHFLLPYGSGDSMLQDLEATSLKRATATAQGEDNRAFASILARVSQDLIVSRNLGENDYTDTEMRKIALDKAKALSHVTSVYSMILPFSPKYSSPHQLYIDMARQMRQTYEGKDGVGGYVNGLDEDGKTWREAFIDRAGEDYWVFTQSLSKSNTGLPPTALGYKAMQKYGDLIAEQPKLGSLVAGPDVYGGAYSTAVSRYQTRERVGPGSSLRQREQLTPEQLMEAEQRDRGWAEFRQMNLMVTASMLARGIKSLSDPRAQALANIKRLSVDRLSQRFEAWGKDYRQFEMGGPVETIDFLNAHAKDPRLDNRPGWTQVRTYLDMRRLMSARLAVRDSQGGSRNLEAKSNADLKRVWDASILGLKSASIDFDEIHSRWLSHDRLIDGG